MFIWYSIRMDLEELAGLEPASPETEKTVYELFKWSVILKGLISVAEVIVGGFLLILPAAWTVAFVQYITRMLEEYAQFGFMSHITEELALFTGGAVLYVAVYLLSRGLIKSFLIWALLRNILWAYPASLIVLGMFLVYQLYEIFHYGSIFVIGITLFDIVVMYFIWREWKIVQSHLTPTA